MILSTVLPAYAVALTGAAVWLRYKRPDWPRMALWFLIPAVVPVAASLIWLAMYAPVASGQLAVSLTVAYVLPAYLLGILICVVADVSVRKVRRG